MRLFLALPIPEAVRQEIERRAGQARRELPRSRWVKPEALHLTLVFLGDTDPVLLPELDEAIRCACSAVVPFPLRLTQAGTFPAPAGGRAQPARVAWIGVDGGRELAELQERVRRAVAAVVPQPLDARPFHAHLTVARCSSPWRSADVERYLRCFKGHLADPFPVDRAILHESVLGPQGSRYRVVSVFPLGDGAAPDGEVRS